MSLSLKAGRKVVKSFNLGKQWQTIEVEAADFPFGISEVELIISPLGWENEFCFIDIVQVLN